MYDTVKIAIPCNQVEFTSFDGYKNISSTNLELLINNNGYTEGPDCVNYEKIYQHNQGYMPSCGVYCYKYRGPKVYFRFSVPKLIFGNNLQEIQQKHFSMVVNQLIASAQNLGIILTTSAIEQAAIWELHVGKNIDLSNYCHSDVILSSLNKLAFDKRFTTGKTGYLNGVENMFIENQVDTQYKHGEKFSIGCKTYELCFYDKKLELEKDIFGKQLLDKHHELKDIFRMEYRLYTAQAVKSGLEKLGLDRNSTFKDCFCDDKFRALNLFIWHKFIWPQIGWLNFFNNDPDILIDKMKKMNIKPMDICKVIGAINIGLSNIDFIFPPKNNVLRRLKGIIDQLQIDEAKLKDTFYYMENVLIENRSII